MRHASNPKYFIRFSRPEQTTYAEHCRMLRVENRKFSNVCWACNVAELMAAKIEGCRFAVHTTQGDVVWSTDRVEESEASHAR